MDKDEARHVSSNSFMETKNPTALALSLGRKHQSIRSNFIKSNDPDLVLEKKISACIEITRRWRGYTCRYGILFRMTILHIYGQYISVPELLIKTTVPSTVTTSIRVYRDSITNKQF